ncbi:ABC transporter substrate-binding protein [Chelatococcus reniformis]|uniref:Leucine-binding protein domain-containing protein n=1 Tax=Chelatococcus reniformis TaxID=1494448 RepID=A0A916X9A5_9HYPH|nr:ABC transporter substrate-binding protein [Chelatococcus reniformis]GGC54172.1 hypothetical protein GCM10010994_11390 [Chelatococcus reniformis]
MKRSFAGMLIPGVVAAAAVLSVHAIAAEVKFADQGVSGAEIVLGTHQDMSGPLKGWSVPVVNGMRLAIDEVNAAGGIDGRKLRLVVEDSGSDPKKAVLATQKLVEKDKIFAMVGAMGSPTVLAPQGYLLDAGVFQLFPFTAAEFTFKLAPGAAQDRLKFANLLPYVESTRAAVKYMMQTGKYKSPCLLHQDDEYGRNVLDGLTQQLEAMKIQPVGVATYKRGASDFSAQTARLKATGCDLLVLGTVIRETIAVMTEAKRTGWDVTVLGATPTNVPEVPQLGKENVEGLYAAGYLQVPDAATATGALKDWLTAYDKRFGIPANTQAILGYNAVMAFATYARLAGKELNGASLLAALESGKPYADIFRSPPIAFSPTNHLGSTVTQIQQVKDGRWEVVSEGLTF